MFKKIIAIAVAVLIVMSMTAIAVSAAEVSESAVGGDSSSAVGADSPNSSGGSGDLIYFDAKGWKSFNKVYAHIWVIGGDSFYGWQTPNEECQKVSGTVFSYDLSKLTGSMDVSGGMKSGGKYGVIFSANTGIQTYDTTIGTECKGDTAELTLEQIENPVDSNKKGYECVWENNSGKYGPHLALTSIGNVVGSKLAPGETGIQVIGDWAPTYFNSPNVDAVKALAGAYPQFGIKTIDDLTNVYAYILTKDGVAKDDLPSIKKTLEDAFYKAYPAQKGQKIDDKDAQQKADSGEASNPENLSGGSSSGGSSSSGGGSSSGGSYSGDSSGSGADGQETTIFFVLGGVMIAAAGAMFISRKKREE
ncbi:MAG: LPXTG cell wall anchor domain-containing protein [Ruminococcus sp.]|nr:LPXTG cell wall anchor domain-containing protein [Ruminococcus sp.]